MSLSQLTTLKSQYDAATARAAELVNRLSADMLMTRPGPERWSAGECIIHLNLTAERFIPLIEEGLKRVPPLPQGEDRKLRMDLIGRLLNWALKPPVRTKTRTSAPFVPVIIPAEEILPAFLRHQERLTGLLAQAEGKAIDKIKIVSPFDARVKYNLYSAFQVIVTHENRHLGQGEVAADRVRR